MGTAFVFKALRGSIVFGLRIVGRAVDSVIGGDDSRPSSPPRPSAPLEPQERTEVVVERPPTVQRGQAPLYAEPDPAPVHVSEEPELVAASAEPGAADGPGPEVRIGEPWEGYRKLNAKDVIDRVGTASDAELAAIELYEAANRARRTVLAAAEKELRSRTAGR